jgi:ParB-like chromosome segregation protein Spo0J
MAIITRISVGEIIVDPDLQPRVAGLDDDHIRALAEDPEAWPPITVLRDGDEMVLLDGAHRLAAALRLGFEDIATEIRDPDGEDPYELAFALNRTHGRALTLRDRRRFASHRLERDPLQSNQSIAALAGLSATTVQAIRARLEASSEIAPTEYEPAVAARVTVERKLGELPDGGLGEAVADRIRAFLEPPSGARQRRAGRFLATLSVALADRASALQGLSAKDAAEALVIVAGEGRAREIATDFQAASEELASIADGLVGTPP